MLTLYIADAERGVGMKNLSQKEAMEILNGMKVKIEIPKAAVTQNKRNAALDMAINALNCSDIPNNSDTISRQAVIDALLGITAMRNTIPLNSAIFNIKKLPSVQPERKGRWIVWYECPFCGEERGYAFDTCPMCGTRMESR